MASNIATGSQVCVIGTEHDLINSTSAGNLGSVWLDLDLNAMADGDILEIRAYITVASGGTQRLLKVWPLKDSQHEPDWQSPPLGFGRSVRWSIKQTAGTGRTIPYDIWKL